MASSIVSSESPIRMFQMSVSSFGEKDFHLPDLEMTFAADFEKANEQKRTLQRMNTIKIEIEEEKKLFKDLDVIAGLPDEQFSRRRGIIDRKERLKAVRGKHEGEAELRLLKHVISRKPGDLKEKMSIFEQLVNGTYEGDPDEHVESSIDHPKLNSVHEKLEDKRQTDIEDWCARRGKTVKQPYTNKEKRILRKWFQQLDYDGSGEVNVEELQDPMLSAGILKTREQVVRVLANVDKNNTNGIDFEEFLMALSANKLADQSKLRRLQEMSADPFFDMDTLITAERRQKLIVSVLRECEERQAAIDKIYKKFEQRQISSNSSFISNNSPYSNSPYSNHSYISSIVNKQANGRKEHEQLRVELEELEEEQARSIYLHLKYIHALDGVIQDRNAFYFQQLRDRDKQWEDRLRRLSPRSFYNSIGPVRLKSANRQEAVAALKYTVPMGGGEGEWGGTTPSFSAQGRRDSLNDLAVAVQVAAAADEELRPRPRRQQPASGAASRHHRGGGQEDDLSSVQSGSISSSNLSQGAGHSGSNKYSSGFFSLDAEGLASNPYRIYAPLPPVRRGGATASHRSSAAQKSTVASSSSAATAGGGIAMLSQQQKQKSRANIK